MKVVDLISLRGKEFLAIDARPPDLAFHREILVWEPEN
jgi:hypothetical protein